MSSNRVELLELIHEVCEQFENLLKHEQQVCIDDWLQIVGEQDRPELFLELLRLEVFHNVTSSSNNSIGDYFRRYPDFSNEVVKVFAENRIAGSEEDAALDAELPFATVVAGQQIGRYRIISPLGAGGFSEVFLAHDPKANQAVAMKLLRQDMDANITQSVKCIVNEANVLSQIEHPSIPKVYDTGKDESGNPWVAMEFIKGESLYQKLATDQLSLVEVLRLLVKTAEGLHEIHQCGFAHRDIKPDNIIIGLDGAPRILDYGLALHEDLQKDKSGERAGTTAFMSPEQVRGHSDKLDGRTDIWSLGVILYLVIAKRLPFQGDTKVEIHQNILTQPVRPPRQIKDNVATIQLEEICFRALRKNPEERFSTAHDFADTLKFAINVLPQEVLLEEASRNRALTRSEQLSIQLARYASIWKAQPASGNLPSLYSYFRFQAGTSKSCWSEAESKLMAAATRKLVRLGLLLSLLAFVFFLSQSLLNRHRRDDALRDLVSVIQTTPISDVIFTYQELSAFAPEEAYAAIEKSFESVATSDLLLEEKIRLAIVLLKDRPELGPLLRKRLLDARPDEVEALRELTIDTDIVASTLKESKRQQLSKIIFESPSVDGIEELRPDLPDSINEIVEGCGGKVTRRFAVCFEMPLTQFKKLSAEMRAYQYRPVVVQPWFNGHREQVVSAIWHRDSADWKITYDLSPADFSALISRETMHLIDVSDGLQAAGDDPKLMAVWSNYNDPYGESRHRLLAEDIPSIADPKWKRIIDLNYAIIDNDIDARYLANGPLLVDVSFDSFTNFTPRESREHQKIHVGKMIRRAGSSKSETHATPEDISRHEIGEMLISNARFKLGHAFETSDSFELDSKLVTWEDLLDRTRQLAHSNESMKARYCRSMLQKSMKVAIENKKRPVLTTRIAIAINHAVGLEIDFWETKDLDNFIFEVRRRLRKVERERANKKHPEWAEYYSLAIALNAVRRSKHVPESRISEVRELSESLVKKSLRARPSLLRRYKKELAFRSTLASPMVKPYLQDEESAVFTSSWTSFAANYQSKFLKPLSAGAQKEEWDKLEDSFLPIAIVHGKRVDGKPRIGSIWHREMMTADLEMREQRVANALCYALKYNTDMGIWKILAVKRSSSLKERVIDTVRLFDIDISVLLSRLVESTDENERVSIFRIIGNYSKSDIDLLDAMSISSSLDLLNYEQDSASEELIKIIRMNLTLN